MYQVVEKVSRGQKRKITGTQIRAARAIVRWSANELAEQAQIGVMTVRRAEAADDVPPLIPNNLDAIQSALEEAGVEFTGGDGELPGVRSRGRKAKRG